MFVYIFFLIFNFISVSCFARSQLESTAIQEFNYYNYCCYCYNHHHHHSGHSTRAITFSSFSHAKEALWNINLASFSHSRNSPYFMQPYVFLPSSSEAVTKPYLIQTNPLCFTQHSGLIDLPYIPSNYKVRETVEFSNFPDPFRLC